MIVDPSAATAAEPGRGVVASPGETIGKYRLDRVLGLGGMGIVWAAFDPDLERAIAIKLLHSSDEPTLRSRLLREARAMARLKHPNVLTVYEVGTDKNRDYIAMEIVDGGTLDAWLATKPPRPEIITALLAAGRGLAAAHAAGLVHRDFKPHNVLRSKDGHVFVTDFGLARGQIEDGADPPVATPVTSVLDILVSPLTQTGVMIGTPAYMAPEQFAGKIPDARTDQFAFCVTAWEALTGARPFRGETLPDLEKAVAAGPANLVADLPPKLHAILVRGLDPSPDARWPDLAALLDALAAAIEPAPVRSRRTPIIAAAVAGTLALGAGGTYLATRGSSSGAAVDSRREARCEPVATAFESAWPHDRRAAVLRENGEKAMAYVFFLDDLRTRWQQAYAQACKEPVTPRSEQRLACLLAVRTQAAALTSRLASRDDVVDMMETIALTSALGSCTGKSELPFQESLPDEARDKLEKARKLIQIVPGRVPTPPAPPDPDELPDPAAPEVPEPPEPATP